MVEHANAQHITISIHALREEGDQPRRPKWTHGPIFLSTPSARRATAVRTACARLFCRISIHALREEGDHVSRAAMVTISAFLSTPSARRATIQLAVYFY